MSNYQACAQSLYRALRNDPFYMYLEQSIEDAGRGAQDAMLAYYILSMQDAARWGRLTLPDQGPHGAAVWTLPLNAQAVEQRRAERTAALENALGARAAETYAAMDRSIAEREAKVDLEGLWYLSILGVDPSLQGRGLGARLLRPVLDEADAAGRASFLTTFSPGNIRFYEGLGFECRAVFPEPVTGADVSVLIRPARPTD